MTDLELIFSMLGEASTTEIAKNKTASIQGGNVAGNARKELERKSGRRVSTKQNYLTNPQRQKSLKE